MRGLVTFIGVVFVFVGFIMIAIVSFGLLGAEPMTLIQAQTYAQIGIMFFLGAIAILASQALQLLLKIERNQRHKQ